MRPHVNDLVVALAGGDNTLAVLLLNFFDLALSVANLFVAFLRDDHVVDTDGHTGLGRFAETDFFEFVQHDHGLVMASKLVTFPNQITEVGFLHRLVVEAEFRRPDLAEHNATNGRINDFLLGIAESGFLAEVRIRQANAIVRFHTIIAVSVNDFFLRAEQRQFARVRRQRLARFSGDVIATERDVLRRRDDRLAG